MKAPIYSSLAAVRAEVQPTDSTEALVAHLSSHNLFHSESVIAHSVTSIPGPAPKTLVSVDVQFCFVDVDTSDFHNIRATGIADSEVSYLTNAGLAEAKRAALLSVFGCVAEPVQVVAIEPVTPAAPTPADAKEAVNAHLQQAGLAPLSTADLLPEKKEKTGSPTPTVPPVTVPQTPERYTKEQQAQNAKTLMQWQDGCGMLSIEKPDDWTNHLQAMKAFPFIRNGEKLRLFTELKQLGAKYGVGWNDGLQRFYLMELPEIDDTTHIPL